MRAGVRELARGDTGALLAIGGAVTVGVLPVFLVGGMAVQIRAELGLPMGVLGLAGSVFFATSALVARPLASVTERIGPTSALRLATTGSAGCLAALSAAPSTPWLLAGLAAAGIPTALSQPAANELLMARIAPRRRGLAFAVKQCAIPVSTLLAGLAVGSVALTIGWRWAFLLAGLIGLIVAPATPRIRWPRAPVGTPDSAASSGLTLLALAAATGLGAAAANAMGTFLTVSAVGVGYREATAGLMLSLGSAAGLAVRLAAGALADRAQPDLLRMVAVMLGLGAVGYLLLALGQPVVFLVGIVLGFGAGWAWPGVFNYAVAARFPDRVATATSVTQTGVYLGAGGGPLLFGLVAEHFGMAAAWLASGTLAALAAVTVILARQ
ncbi:MAG TPA: MFS transporter [Pseudonocardiaceae bacterium]|nr:MFS transporter [Pseudonocardiaceae bacterium]